MCQYMELHQPFMNKERGSKELKVYNSLMKLILQFIVEDESTHNICIVITYLLFHVPMPIIFL